MGNQAVSRLICLLSIDVVKVLITEILRNMHNKNKGKSAVRILFHFQRTTKDKGSQININNMMIKEIKLPLFYRKRLVWKTFHLQHCAAF